MNRVVCVGPTLYGIDVSNFDGLYVHPPAARGDLLRLALDGATAILLIDGLYGDRPSVSHKEILFALSRGIPVLGAASLGALRAVECAAFGMLGTGSVFAAYRSGARVSDADVAVLHAPAELGWRPLSLSLVDIDATLDAVPDMLSPDTSLHLRKVARRLHFSNRTWESIAEAAGAYDSVGVGLANRTVHRKRQDALEALDVFRRDLPAPPTFDFAPTDTFIADVARYAPERLDDFGVTAASRL